MSWKYLNINLLNFKLWRIPDPKSFQKSNRFPVSIPPTLPFSIKSGSPRALATVGKMRLSSLFKKTPIICLIVVAAAAVITVIKLHLLTKKEIRISCLKSITVSCLSSYKILTSSIPIQNRLKVFRSITSLEKSTMK